MNRMRAVRKEIISGARETFDTILRSISCQTNRSLARNALRISPHHRANFSPVLVAANRQL